MTEAVIIDDDGTSTLGNPWNVMVDYERAEAIAKILAIASNSLFRHDLLRLVERTDVSRTSHSLSTSSDGLLLYGHVSPVRSEAFLSVLRRLRHYTITDLMTSVRVGHVTHDNVPHIFLEPLVNCRRTEALRRWYRAHYAMRCGVLYSIQQRREKTKERLGKIIRRKHSLREGESDPFSPDFYHKQFLDLASGGGADEGDDAAKRFLPLSEYEKATKETRIDMARAAANVPTLFVVWSHRDTECMAWLRAKLFNDVFIKEIRAKTGLAARFATMFDSDPWLNAVQEHLEIPPRKQMDRKNRLDILPDSYKRAQIVMINVDAEQPEARRAYGLLLTELKGWRSPEVSIVSLWTGPEGLQSHFAFQFEIDQLPFVIATTPAKRNYKTYVMSPPKLHMVPTALDREDIADNVPLESDDSPHTWAGLPAATRESVLQDLAVLFKDPSASLFLSARIDRVHRIANPYTPIATRALGTTVSSRVCLRGCLTEEHLRRWRATLRLLWGLADFEFSGDVVRPSPPIEIALDTMTPRRYVLGVNRTVTCAVCRSVVAVDEEPHYHCLHCAPASGQLCEHCCSEGLRHPDHHIFVRMPPCPAVLSLPVLWGPSNILPLRLFCGRVVRNTGDLHVGVYCNRCKGDIRGIRWKCVVCAEYDLCHVCYRKSIVKKELELLQEYDHNFEAFGRGEMTAHAALQTPNSQGHALCHPLLCIRNGRDGDNSDFIAPEVISDPLGYMNALPDS